MRSSSLTNAGLVAGIMLLVCGTATAQWSDNFDGYANGTLMDNVGGWAGWDNVAAAAGTITNAQSLSAPHSITVSGTGDAVHPFSGYTAGQWVFTAYQYIPENLDSTTYFILNNQYSHFGPYDWALQMRMEPSLGLVFEDIRDPSGTFGIPLIFDQWVELRTLIDLDNNYMETYYGGTLLASGVWNAFLGGPIELQNVDLFGPHTVPVYYDNFNLAVPAPGSLALMGLGAVFASRRRRG